MWFNPMMKSLLKSRLHFLASASTMLLTFRGLKSGRSYATPVSFLEIDGTMYTISSRERVWWRNLRRGEQVGLRVAGKEIRAQASVIEDQEQVRAALSEYLRRAPERARYFGVKLDPNGNPMSEDLYQLAKDKVVVTFDHDAVQSQSRSNKRETIGAQRKSSVMDSRSHFAADLDLNPRKLALPAIVMLTFLALGTLIWRSTGVVTPLFFFGYIGLSVGVGLGLYAALPKKKKPLGRRLSLILVGLFLIGFAAIQGQENMQIEGVFFGLLGGVVQAAVVHYLIAKIFGPMLFGRIWCGWACWTVMVLDLLPFKRPAGRLPGRWGWVRYLHFAVSLGLVLIAWYGFGFQDGTTGRAALAWYVTGNLLYYASGIALAYTLKDNRAFCKYLCPVTVPLKIATRFALLKIEGEPQKCNDCRACVKMCPMDIRVPDYILNGKRVLSTECSLCQTCITVCAKDALKLSFGFDMGGEDLLREREVYGNVDVRNENVLA